LEWLIEMTIAVAMRYYFASTDFVLGILQLNLQKVVYGGEALAERIGQWITSLALGGGRSCGSSNTKIFNIVRQTL